MGREYLGLRKLRGERERGNHMGARMIMEIDFGVRKKQFCRCEGKSKIVKSELSKV